MNEWEWQLLEDKSPADSVEIDSIEVRKGDRVLLRPRAGGDIFDLALAGQTAIVEAIEQDYEGKLQLAVVLEEDPGKDMGVLRQPGHRFFFKPEEVEPCASKEVNVDAPTTQDAKILIAGIGNIFFGDDAFGVEVAKRLAADELPKSVRVEDFGIRGYDLAYALLEPYRLIVLIDACPRGQKPGSVYVIEPELSETGELAPIAVDAHTMNPMQVLRLARAMGPIPSRIVLVGCEPATLGGEEGKMGLSEPVSAAIDEAVRLVGRIIETTLSDENNAACYGA
jgi:hydrogenase maturation protease